MIFSLLFLFGKAANAYTITSNTTWSSSQPTFTGITITNGATLTITGSGTTISVAGSIDVKPGCTLIVENHATLKMDSSIILENIPSSSGTGAMLETNHDATFTALHARWNGIQVWGPAAYGLNGGASAILNDATIEKAVTGVATYKQLNPSTKTNKGGIIEADWCTFQDNYFGVDLMQNPQYAAQSPTGPIITIPTNSPSYFKFCNFYNINSTIIVPNKVDLQITDAKGISVLGCIFKNEITDELTIIGIQSLNSEVRVAPGTVTASWGGYCCAIYTQPCKFINLSAGVNLLGPKTFNRIVAQQALFQNCGYGIYILGSLQSMLIQNDITDMGQWYVDPYGIMMYGSTGYTVELNNIEGGLQEPIGIWNLNSGADYNEIFKNTISNVDVGMKIVGINRSADGLTGLELLCNNMHSNSLNISTGILGLPDGSSNLPQEGIAKYQGIASPNGTTRIAAGNLFATQRGPAAYGNDRIFFYPPMQPFTYWYSNASSYENPVYVSPNVTLQLVTPNQCPTYASKPYIAYASFITDIAQVESQINAYQLSQQNSSMSPNASTSPTDSIGLAGLWRVHQKIIDSMMITFMYLDSTEVHYDSMAMALEAVHLGYFNKVKLAGLYLTQLRYDDAINLLSSIPAAYNLSTAEAEDVLNMKDMYVVIDSLVHNDHQWDSLSTAMKQNVAAVAEDNGAYGTPVARYLQARYEGIFYRPDDQEHKGAASPTMVHVPQSQVADKIYPNPANNQLSINWTSKGKLSLRLFDLSGKEVLHTAIHSGWNNLNIQDLTSGVYMADIYENGHSVYQQKIIKK